MTRVATLILVVLFAAAAAHARQAPSALPSPPSDDEIARNAERLFKGYEETGLFSGAFLVARGETVLFQGAAGLANAEFDVPNTIETRFGISALSQLFTVSAVLRLVEGGRLDLHAPVGRHMTGWPEPYQALTAHQLLIGKSGVKDVTRIPAFVQSVALPRSTQELAAVILKEPLGTPPPVGRPNNSEYHLLAAVVERAAGLAFTEYVRREVIERAGLARTGHNDPSAILDRRASSFTETSAGLRHADPFHMSNAVGMANLLSTVGDVHRFFRALVTGKVISKASLELMSTAHVPMRDLGGGRRGPGFGYGISLLGRTWWSGGGIGGYFAHLSYDPDREVLGLILGNTGNSAGTFGLLNARNALLVGRPFHVPVKRAAVTPDPGDLTRLAGEWRTENPAGAGTPLTLRIRVDDGRVFVQVGTTGGDYEWFAEGPGRFFARHADAQIVLAEGSADQASYVVTGIARVIRRQPR